MAANECKQSEHVDHYLALVDSVPHRAEGESVLLNQVPLAARRILDLGTGDGRLLALVRAERPESVAVAVDVSEPMLQRARERFADQPVELLHHALAEPLPDLGRFDSVVSSLAIHHLEDERKRSLYAEILVALEPGGVFANFEHVASPTARLHYNASSKRSASRSSAKTPRTASSMSRPSCTAPRSRFRGRRLLLEVARAGPVDRGQA